MAYEPSDLYICNRDGTINPPGAGSFTTILPGGLQSVSGIDIVEYSMYDLLPCWRYGSFLYHSVNGNVINSPMPNGIINTVTDFLTLLNNNLVADGYNPSSYNFQVSPNSPYKLRFNFPVGVTVTFLGNGQPINLGGGNIIAEPYKTSIARWIGVGQENVVADPTLGYVDLPFFYKLIRTTCFYIHSSLSANDSIVATDDVTAFPDTSTLLKLINTSTGFGSLIYYQSSLENVVSKRAYGSSVYQISFNILDDEFLPMGPDIEDETYIHMTLRLSYAK
jgi:hypothetical protein